MRMLCSTTNLGSGSKGDVMVNLCRTSVGVHVPNARQETRQIRGRVVLNGCIGGAHVHHQTEQPEGLHNFSGRFLYYRTLVDVVVTSPTPLFCIMVRVRIRIRYTVRGRAEFRFRS